MQPGNVVRIGDQFAIVVSIYGNTVSVRFEEDRTNTLYTFTL